MCSFLPSTSGFVCRSRVLSVAFISVSMAGCGGRICQPDRCGEGAVCGLAGRCEASQDVFSLDASNAGAPFERRTTRYPDRWGTNEGSKPAELVLGDGGQTLYLSFALPAEATDVILILSAAEDSVFGPEQTLRVTAVRNFKQVHTGRLPGPRGGQVGRRVEWQPQQRLDLSALVPVRGDARLSLAIRGAGPMPGWRIATPSARLASLRPRLLVSTNAGAR